MAAGCEDDDEDDELDDEDDADATEDACWLGGFGRAVPHMQQNRPSGWHSPNEHTGQTHGAPVLFALLLDPFLVPPLPLFFVFGILIDV